MWSGIHHKNPVIKWFSQLFHLNFERCEHQKVTNDSKNHTYRLRFTADCGGERWQLWAGAGVWTQHNVHFKTTKYETVQQSMVQWSCHMFYDKRWWFMALGKFKIMSFGIFWFCSAATSRFIILTQIKYFISCYILYIYTLYYQLFLS